VGAGKCGVRDRGIRAKRTDRSGRKGRSGQKPGFFMLTVASEVKKRFPDLRVAVATIGGAKMGWMDSSLQGDLRRLKDEQDI
jgi:hypothetical protein